jgi:hypothetical protein
LYYETIVPDYHPASDSYLVHFLEYKASIFKVEMTDGIFDYGLADTKVDYFRSLNFYMKCDYRMSGNEILRMNLSTDL